MAFSLGIIPARGGSKGVPNKNITVLRGKPLLAYTIEAALASQELSGVVVSTDSEKIAECAAQYGIRVQELRPARLATDEAKTLDVVAFEISQYESKHEINIDTVILLQPTCPFRTAADIDGALRRFQTAATESLVSVYDASSVHPAIMYYYDVNRLVPVLETQRRPRRRQDRRPAYVRNGAIYVSSRRLVMERGLLMEDTPAAYFMPAERSINIDEPFDLEMAEWLMSRNDA